MRLAIIINKELPLGLAANAAAILGLSIGRAAPECVGPDIPDASGGLHPGITNLPIPVLGADPRALKDLRDRVAGDTTVRFADFSNIAQRTRTYDEYTGLMIRAEPRTLEYLGLCVYGDDASVRRLTGGFPLLGR